MKKLFLYASFVLVVFSTQAQIGYFNNQGFTGNYSGNHYNNGYYHNNGNNNNGAGIAVAGINGLTQIITTAIVAKAATDVFSEQEKTRQMEIAYRQSVAPPTQTSVVFVQSQPRLCYTDWQDVNGNWWRTSYACQ